MSKQAVSKMLNTMDIVHEHLSDQNFVDKKFTRDKILELQKMCGQVVADIDEHLKKHPE